MDIDDFKKVITEEINSIMDFDIVCIIYAFINNLLMIPPETCNYIPVEEPVER